MTADLRLVGALFALLASSPATGQTAAAQGPVQFVWASVRDSSNGPARSAAVFRRTLSIDLPEVRLDTALAIVSRVAGVHFAYSRAVVPVDRLVTIHGSKLPLADVLEALLAGSSVDVALASSGQVALIRHRQAQANPGIAVPLYGVVRDSATGVPIAGANVSLVGLGAAARTGPDGTYRVAAIPLGLQTVRARAVGYRPNDAPVLGDGHEEHLDFTLSPLAVTLAEVVVTPGRYALMEEPMAQQATLSKEDLQTMPQIGEDLYRAVNRLPGMTSNEMSAKFWVRGGTDDEVLVRLDGLELYEPFHLKDFDGSLSIIDVQSVNDVELLTGGFSADYGNRLTGVFNLQTIRDTLYRSRFSAGVTLGNARVAGRGGFARGRGQWMISLRRGYVDVILKTFNLLSEGEELSPRYYDGLATLHYRLNNKHSVAFNLLRADDQTTYHNDNSPVLRSGYGSNYAWGDWEAAFGTRVKAQTVLSAGRLSWRRQGAGLEGTFDSISLDDHRWFNVLGAKQDWSIAPSRRQLVRFGVEAKALDADYRYLNWRQDRQVVNGTVIRVTDSAQANLSPAGSVFGGFLAYRLQPVGGVTVEVGGRADHQSYLPQWTFSPRVSLAWTPRRGTTLRGAWGRYFQPQQLFELDVQDGDPHFYPAQLAEHRVVGVEQSFANGFSVTVEAYQRILSHLRPRPVNLVGDIEAFPELLEDRVLIPRSTGEARGLEVFLRRRGLGRWDWSLSYALAEVWDDIEGRRVPRRLDQRHTLYGELGYHPNFKWSLSVAWQYHTGWPATPSDFTLVNLTGGGRGVVQSYGPLNSARLPSYHRMDARVSRRFRIGRGQLLAFLDVFNLYDRKNPRSFFYNVDLRNGQLVQHQMIDQLLPILPTFGISIDF